MSKDLREDSSGFARYIHMKKLWNPHSRKCREKAPGATPVRLVGQVPKTSVSNWTAYRNERPLWVGTVVDFVAARTSGVHNFQKPDKFWCWI